MNKFLRNLHSVSIADNPQYAIVGRSSIHGAGILSWHKTKKEAIKNIWKVWIIFGKARITTAYEAMN
jgi:membrane-anchored glycerophosphoryl diester phosphodiesterase (GDPDase)